MQIQRQFASRFPCFPFNLSPSSTMLIMGVNALFFIFLRILSTLCILPNTCKVFIPYMLAVQMYIKPLTLFNLHFRQWVTLLNNIVLLLVFFFIHNVIIYSRSLFSDFQYLITCQTLCRLCIMSLNNDAKFWRLGPLRINFLHSCPCFLFFYYLVIVEGPSVEKSLDILHLNIRSIRNKIDSLMYLVHDFDICVLQKLTQTLMFEMKICSWRVLIICLQKNATAIVVE